MENNELKAYCRVPVALRNYNEHTIGILHDLGFRELPFGDSKTKYLIVHHVYIMFGNKISEGTIDCGSDVRKFLKEVIG